MSQQKDEVMNNGTLKADLKVKQVMLEEEPIMTSRKAGTRGSKDQEEMEVEENEEEQEVPNEIRMDGEEYMDNGKPKTDKVYKARSQEEEQKLNLQKAEFTGWTGRMSSWQRRKKDKPRN